MGTKRGRVQASSGPHLGKVYTNRLDLVAGSSLEFSAVISFPDVGGGIANDRTVFPSRHLGEFYADVISIVASVYFK